MQKWKYREHEGKKGKFRVGDLVQLSSYGKSTEQNSNNYFDGNEMGLIICVSGKGFKRDKYPILIQWINISKENVPTRFFFRELILKRT